MAARELSGKFEDKFRVLLAQRVSETGGKVPVSQEPPQARVKATKAQRTTSKPTVATARERVPASQPSAPAVRRQSSGGPGRPPLQHVPSSTAPAPAPAPVPAPAANDASMQLMLQMERRMAEMQAELNLLRSQQEMQAQQVQQVQQVQQAPARSSSSRRGSSHHQQATPVAPAAFVSAPQSAPQSALEPLTLAEKKSLIQQIQTLKPERLGKVVEIIQAATGLSGSEEMEIPIDELDTATLRKLQEYVEGKKKSTPSRSRSTGPSGGPASKKSRKSEPSAQVNNAGKNDNSPSPRPNPKLEAQANSGLLPSLQTLKRPRSDSIEFDDLMSGSHELLPLDDIGKGSNLEGEIPKNDNWAPGEGSIESKKDEEQDLGRDVSWGTAIDEKEATRSRELDRKAEEERQFEVRAKAEADRLEALQRDAAKKEEERQRALAAEEQKKEEHQRMLLAAREEERRLRQEMQQTVNLDQQQEALMMLDDI